MLLVDKDAGWLEGDEAEAATSNSNRPHGAKEEVLAGYVRTLSPIKEILVVLNICFSIFRVIWGFHVTGF